MTTLGRVNESCQQCGTVRVSPFDKDGNRMPNQYAKCPQCDCRKCGQCERIDLTGSAMSCTGCGRSLRLA